MELDKARRGNKSKKEQKYGKKAPSTTQLH